MDSFWASLGEYFKQRTVSPLGGAFVSSWCIINYRFFVMLFADIPHQDKFDAISDFYSKDYNFLWLWDPVGYWSLGVMWPLLAVFIYLFIYPLCSLGAYVVSLYFQRRMFNLKRRSAGMTLLTKEEGNLLKEDRDKNKVENDALYIEIDVFKEVYHPLIFIKDLKFYYALKDAAEKLSVLNFFNIDSLYDPEIRNEFNSAGYDFSAYVKYVFKTVDLFDFYKDPLTNEYCKVPTSIYEVLNSKVAISFFNLMKKANENSLTHKYMEDEMSGFISGSTKPARLISDMLHHGIIFSNQLTVGGGVSRANLSYTMTPGMFRAISRIFNKA